MNPPAYSLEQVRFGYGDDLVLDIPEFSIEPGQVIGLVGANGAGKTSMLNLLAFLNQPKQGSIQFFGTAINQDNLNRARRRVAIVQQNPYLLRRSVLGNIEFGLQMRGLSKAHCRTGACDMIDELGLQALAHRPANELSGGEAQKVAIARALVLQPEVLLFDEPFTHLDRKFAQEMEALIGNIREHREQTLIFTTHDRVQALTLTDQVYSVIATRLVPANLLNLFRGDMRGGHFDTGKMELVVLKDVHAGSHVAIEPAHIVLSNEPLRSSMRNNFQGRITGLSEFNGEVYVTVDASERFYALVTRSALAEQGWALGQDVWLSFKTSAVLVF